MSGIDRSRASTMIGNHHEGDEEEDPIVHDLTQRQRTPFATIRELENKPLVTNR